MEMNRQFIDEILDSARASGSRVVSVRDQDEADELANAIFERLESIGDVWDVSIIGNGQDNTLTIHWARSEG